MFQRHRLYRLLIALFSVLMLSGVLASFAQSNTLTQVVQSAGGQFSIRLPEGWQAQQTSFPAYPTMLHFGDTAGSLQSEINNMGTQSPNLYPGMSGFFGIVDTNPFSGSTTSIMSQILNTMGQIISTQGAEIVNEQLVTLSGGYSTDVAIVDLPDGSIRGYYGVLQAGDTLIQFQLTGRSGDVFDANQQLLGNILDSVRVPAEDDNVIQPTRQAQPNPPINNDGGTVVVSQNDVFSADLPAGYQSESVNNVDPTFGDLLVFGNSAATEQTVMALLSGNNIGNLTGVGGFIAQIDPSQLAGQALDSLVSPVMDSMLSEITNQGEVSAASPESYQFGSYTGLLTELEIGYVGVFHTDTDLFVVLVVSDDVSGNQDQIDHVLSGIRVPPQQHSQPIQPPTAQPPQPTAQATSSSENTPQIVRSSDGQVSLVLPGAGTVLDHIADNNILAYGDSDAAAQSRLYSGNPNLAPKTSISGSGGIVILYSMDRFGIDPQNPDLAPLMQQALNGLKGYTVEQGAQPLEGKNGAYYAVIGSGVEKGYLALIPFGDQIAYVTATTTPDSFEANKAFLLEIVKSVQVPAVNEDSGLGGLGGLDNGTPVTPEPTEEVGGLGGL